MRTQNRVGKKLMIWGSIISSACLLIGLFFIFVKDIVFITVITLAIPMLIGVVILAFGYISHYEEIAIERARIENLERGEHIQDGVISIHRQRTIIKIF
jgi:hypothetical protein